MTDSQIFLLICACLLIVAYIVLWSFRLYYFIKRYKKYKAIKGGKK